MTALPTRPLGRSGLTVSILGFGGAPLGDLYDLLDDEIAHAIGGDSRRLGRDAL